MPPVLAERLAAGLAPIEVDNETYAQDLRDRILSRSSQREKYARFLRTVPSIHEFDTTTKVFAQKSKVDWRSAPTELVEQRKGLIELLEDRKYRMIYAEHKLEALTHLLNLVYHSMKNRIRHI